MPHALKLTLIFLLMLLVTVFILIVMANMLMSRQASQEAATVLSTANTNEKDIVQPSELEGLPACVQRWLQHSGVIGKERVHTVRLMQEGRMRTEEGKPWMPFTAVQYINIDQPGFVWLAQVKMAPLLYLKGKDKYEHGQGNMQIKVLGLVPVVDARPGKEMNQGSMLRFLAEMIWYPSAALNDYIKWEEIDDHSARATMTWQGVSAFMEFNFNEEGDLVNNVGPRYREVGGKFVLDDWGGEAREYREFHGIRILNKSDVVWKYKTGDFNWLQVEITDIEFNKPQLY